MTKQVIVTWPGYSILLLLKVAIANVMCVEHTTSCEGVWLKQSQSKGHCNLPLLAYCLMQTVLPTEERLHVLALQPVPYEAFSMVRHTYMTI